MTKRHVQLPQPLLPSSVFFLHLFLFSLFFCFLTHHSTTQLSLTNITTHTMVRIMQEAMLSPQLSNASTHSMRTLAHSTMPEFLAVQYATSLYFFFVKLLSGTYHSWWQRKKEQTERQHHSSPQFLLHWHAPLPYTRLPSAKIKSAVKKNKQQAPLSTHIHSPSVSITTAPRNF